MKLDAIEMLAHSQDCFKKYEPIAKNLQTLKNKNNYQLNQQSSTTQIESNKQFILRSTTAEGPKKDFLQNRLQKNANQTSTSTSTTAQNKGSFSSSLYQQTTQKNIREDSTSDMTNPTQSQIQDKKQMYAKSPKTKKKLSEAMEQANMYNDKVIRQHIFDQQNEEEELNFLELCQALNTIQDKQ